MKNINAVKEDLQFSCFKDLNLLPQFCDCDPHAYLSTLSSIFQDACAFARHHKRCSPPQTTRHKLQIVSSFLRALRLNDIQLAEHLALIYPTCAKVPLNGWWGSDALNALEKHFIELFQRDSHERSMSAGDEDFPHSAEQFVEFGGLGSAYSAIYKLKPGGHNTISAITVHSHLQPDPLDTPSFSTSPPVIAAELNRTWTSSFALQSEMLEDPSEFLACVSDFAACGSCDLLPDQQIAESVVGRARDSATGPDGRPYSSYRACPEVSAWLVACFCYWLFQDGFELEQSLLLSFMVFLPKKKFTFGPGGIKIFAPGSTRPLSLSNTFLKLVSICFKIRVCEIVDQRIHVSQKCIAGRNLLDNVLLLDAMMHKLSISDPDNALAIFFDLANAFPSVAHLYLWKVLEVMGFPAAFVRAVQRMYKHNVHLIKIGQKVFPGPTILRGVKTGCPLSMILFALCLEPLLRHLHGIISGEPDKSALGCFADDLGIVLRSFALLREVRFVFDWFARVSSLQLNLAKCVIVPLGRFSDYDLAAEKVLVHSPAWQEMQICSSAEYLGFILGPGSPDLQWGNATAKAKRAAEVWAKIGCGFFYSLLACNIFVFPVLTYIGQLARTGTAVKECSDYVIRKMFVGPGNWLPPDLLQHVKLLGMPTNIRDIETSVFASKVRVAKKSELPIINLATEVGLHVANYNRNSLAIPEHDLWHQNVL